MDYTTLNEIILTILRGYNIFNTSYSKNYIKVFTNLYQPLLDGYL